MLRRRILEFLAAAPTAALAPAAPAAALAPNPDDLQLKAIANKLGAIDKEPTDRKRNLADKLSTIEQKIDTVQATMPRCPVI